VRNREKPLVTMADLSEDDGPFTLMEDSHKGKKHRVSKQEAPRANHVYETPARVSF